jgi:hypothetical protein
MLHRLPKFHSPPDPQAPDVEPDVPAATHHHLPAFVTAIGHIHVRLPEPGPSYPLHEADYLEAGEMSRLMDHL